MVKTAVAIALGSNLGDSLQTLNKATSQLSQHPAIDPIACSSWYRTKPIGPPQPDYLNGCLTCATSLEPKPLLDLLLHIEQQFGRERKERWGARTLDLDIILYGDRLIEQPHLHIPHPQMQHRAFVLVPLAEIAPDWIDPRSQQTIAQLLQHLDTTEIHSESQ